MRIMFATDLHGSTLVFQKAVSLSILADADVLIVGGDLSGKRLLPIVPVSNASFRVGEPFNQKDDSGTSLSGNVFREVKKGDLDNVCQRWEAKGYYWHVAEEAEIRRLNETPEELTLLFERKIVERIEKWA